MNNHPPASVGLLASLRAPDFLLPFVLVFAFTLFNPRLLGDGDSYWHVAAGQWIIDHAAIPRTDPFSHTFAGKDWHVHEWLAEVIFALFHKVGGWAGVLLLSSAAVSGAVAIVHQHLRRHIGWPGAAMASLLALACLAPSLLARPHILSLPLLALWTKVLLDARSQSRAPHPGWLALILIWSNMHGSVMFAVALFGPFALEALLGAPADWKRIVRQWAIFGIGAAIAMLITPRGIEGTIFLVKLTQMESLKSIIEWMPPDLTRVGGIQLLVAAGLLAMLWRGVKVPPIRIVLLLLLLWLTIQHQRHQVLLAITGTMICCEAIGASLGERKAGWMPHRALSLVLGLALLVLAAARLAVPVAPAESARSPRTALAAVPVQVRKGNVLNYYSAGGFLIANGVRPFIDGRTDLYQDAFFARYEAIADDRAGALDKALADFRIGWTMLETGSPAAQSLDRKPGWRRLHTDRYATIHVRQSAP